MHTKNALKIYTKNSLKIYTKNASETDLSLFVSLSFFFSLLISFSCPALPLSLSLLISLYLSSLSEMRYITLREKRDREIKRGSKERETERGRQRAGVERECLPGDDDEGNSDEGDDDDECGGPSALDRVRL